jgi:hypothetical protein
LQKIAHFNKVNRKNKKRDKPKKEDLSRVVHPVELFSKQKLELLNNFLKLFLNHPKHTRF